jgi:hypothetical protein
MKKSWILVAVIFVLAQVLADSSAQSRNEQKIAASLSEGLSIFRDDTFGDEQLWTDVLQMQKAVSQLTPRAALGSGLKVDSEALPQSIIDAIKAGTVNLEDPKVTIQLLKLNAVVGVRGKVVGANDHLATVGITCALCHSMVDNSVAPGIGKRLDGWPNRDLNVGAIIALSPAISNKQLFQSWGPGKFDPRLQAFNGTGFISLNETSIPVLIPPAFGLKDVALEIYTGDGPISYWNNYVGVTQMGGHGSFHDDRIGLNITQEPDLVTPKLPALLEYQLGLKTPPPPAGSFNRAAARRGAEVFNGVAQCATCHIPPTYTDAPKLHDPDETGVDREYAKRSATGQYRTTPLRALWQHPPYFHNGSASDLRAVVEHYNAKRSLGLTQKQKDDLIEFLKTL